MADVKVKTKDTTKKKSSNKTIALKLPGELHGAFKKMCENEYKTMTQTLRDFVVEKVNTRGKH